jgi:hypothetical protein
MGQPAEDEDFRERRALERMPTTLRGKLFPGGIDCLITDYNAKGARLHFEERPAVGDRVVLVVWSSGLAFEAVTRWRTALEIGVQFSSSHDFRARTPARLAPIREIWRKRLPRIGRRKMMKTSAMIQRRRGRDDGMIG